MIGSRRNGVAVATESERRSIWQRAADLIRSPHEHEHLWHRPDDITATCYVCERRHTDLVIYPRYHGPPIHLCRRCAEHTEQPCRGCGAFIPAASNVNGEVWCGVCYQRHRADEQVREFEERLSDSGVLDEIVSTGPRNKALELVREARRKQAERRG